MRIILFILIIISYGCSKKSVPPNIIYILADDLGYGEVGVYGQKIIETPNIDLLAESGILFTDHYSGSPVCAPSRSVLMTGQHSGHTYIRDNGEWNERGNVWSFQSMLDNPELEGQRPLPDSTLTVANVLQKNGYRTGMVGKWGLGAPHTNSVPNKKGFDIFYGYNCQRQAHTFYPTHLWNNQERDFLDNYIVTKQEGLASDADIISYEKYNQKDYAPTLMHQKAVEFVRDENDKPFFLYYASPIPHLPLQAPKKWVDYYRKKIGEEEPYVGRAYYPNQYPKATYAAMISYLDEQVGELVSVLKQTGQYENTIIIFTSDNGPSYVQPLDLNYFESTSFLNNDPERVKGKVYEGGIRVPMIVHWPRNIKEKRVSNHISSFQDFYATVLDLLKLDKPNYIDGLSYLPTLLNNKQPKHEYLYWEFASRGGQQALRYGKWKAIKTNLQKANDNLELFDLEKDPKELNDISINHPDVVKKIEKILTEARTRPDLKNFYIKSLDSD